jgi:NAD(P)H dehydrogenase (quinone)
VVQLRPTVFLQNFFFLAWAAESIAEDGTIRLPFGSGRTSPVDVRDVAEVVAAVLASPMAHIGKVYELTGPRSQDMHADEPPGAPAHRGPAQGPRRRVHQLRAGA